MTDLATAPLELAPDLRTRTWAGSRLAPAAASAGEAWLAHDGSIVGRGPAAGRTMRDLAADLGEDLVGDGQGRSSGLGFPILVKLLDTSDWLSIQVHPDDALAVAFEGPGAVGKTESWLVVEASDEAEVIVGPRIDAEYEEIWAAVGRAALEPLLERVRVAPGDRIHVPAGTLHAVGPGLLVYELQQSSDITYRAWDWGRVSRPLHVAQSRRATRPGQRAEVRRATEDAVAAAAHEVPVASSPFYTAVQLPLSGGSHGRSTDGTSPAVVTVLHGSARLATRSGSVSLAERATAVVPAGAGDYVIESGRGARVVVASAA